MPTLSHHFGLSPSDIWKLTRSEYEAYTNALETISHGH
jgi:hypothetical protein